MLPILLPSNLKKEKKKKKRPYMKMMGMHANKQWLHQAVTENQYRANLLKSGSKAESEEVG